MYPQHHEGIQGTQRAGDPLVTEEGSLVAAEMMGMLYSATLVGHPAPKVATMLGVIHNPVAGQPVVVFDIVYRGTVDEKHKGVGYLIAVRPEWATSDAEWMLDQAMDPSLTPEDRLVEGMVWYVQYGPNPSDVCRWTNCAVFGVPRGLE